jgi:peptidoglycan/LPS O-acetylase OafA/YrhL
MAAITPATRKASAAGSAKTPSPAVAPPPGNPRFALLDSLRGIAVLFLIAFHVASITGALLSGFAGDAITILGPQSVVLFFVLSGFLLYRPFVAARADGKPRPRTRRYARRRALRILPAYWVALSVLATFPGIVGVFSDHWWRYYFFLQIYWHDSTGGGIPVAWSLCVEMAFYISLPLWAAAMGRLRLGSGPRAWLRAELVPLALVALLGVAVQLAAARNIVSDLLATTLLGECVWLALGMSLAVLSVAVERSERQFRAANAIAEHPGVCWLTALAALIALVLVVQPEGLAGILHSISDKQPVAKTLGAIALAGLMQTCFVLPAIFGERAGGMPRKLLAARPVAWLGLISYGLYLWHLAIAEFVAFPADPQHFSASGLDLTGRLHNFQTPVLYLVTVAMATVIAACSYYVIELPFLRRKER